ncbi:MAG: hypothetical protein V1789_07000 [PVC group bacterium]
MRVYQREAERLTAAERLVQRRYPRFGVNKRREVIRLLYEISKKEEVPPAAVLPRDAPADFGRLKKYLLQRRFPAASREAPGFRPYLPKFELAPDRRRQRRDGSFSPRRIYVEESVRDSGLAAAFTAAFPGAERTEIPGLKRFLARHPGAGIPEYNTRTETVFIINEERDFFKRCPCTGKAVPCGYHILNLGFGCIYECTYCYLQEYANTPGLIFPAGTDRFLERFTAYRDRLSTRRWRRGDRLRLGTGEFSDSLMLDDLTGYSFPLVDFFRGRDDVIFEFKTKSANVGNLLKIEPGRNIVVAWSLNPQSVISRNEFYTASLDDRISAAVRVSAAGYRLAFHFDPVFVFNGWRQAYQEVIDEIWGAMKPEAIAWISLGTLRFTPSLKKIIEARFPDNVILDEEMVLGFDDKLRYPAPVRYRVYRFLIDELKKRSRALPVYLCMENRAMWKELGLKFPF